MGLEAGGSWCISSGEELCAEEEVTGALAQPVLLQPPALCFSPG